MAHDPLATEIRLHWPGMAEPATVLTVRYVRALTGAELRTLAAIVDQVEEFRAEVREGATL